MPLEPGCFWGWGACADQPPAQLWNSHSQASPYLLRVCRAVGLGSLRWTIAMARPLVLSLLSRYLATPLGKQRGCRWNHSELRCHHRPASPVVSWGPPPGRRGELGWGESALTGRVQGAAAWHLGGCWQAGDLGKRCRLILKAVSWQNFRLKRSQYFS